MRILIPSGGAREHALAWRFQQDGHEVFTDPKANPGMSQVATKIGPWDRESPESLLTIAKSFKIDLTVIGGETLLHKGIVDLFESKGLAIVGPTKEAARLETSKLYCIRTLQRAGVKVPPTEELSREQLLRCLIDTVPPYVIKFDGLAAGKGAKVIRCGLDASETMQQMAQYAEGPFLKQEFIAGQEVSFFVATNGYDAVFMGSAADYKRLYAENGPMTGGMGGYAPNPVLTNTLHNHIMDAVVGPTIEYMRRAGAPYRGILYFQLMVTPDGQVYVIEINVRFGDPEAQLLMPLYRGDLAQVLASTAKGRKLDASGFSIVPDLCSVGVVLAAQGYPGEVRKGDAISGLADFVFGDFDPIFYGGVRDDKGQLKTNGGRVVTVVGLGHDYKSASESAYLTAADINFEGRQYRIDIAAYLI